MRIDLFAQALQTATLGVIGTSLFIHHMPSTTEQGILIKVPLQGIKRDPSMPGYYKTEIQMIIRHNNTTTGEALANSVMNLFHSHARVEYLDEDDDLVFAVKQMFAQSKPIRYPLSEGNLTEWSINFDVTFFEP